MKRDIQNSFLIRLLTIAWIVISTIPYAGNFTPTFISMPVILSLFFLIVIGDKNIIRSLWLLLPFFLLILIDYFVDSINGESTSIFEFIYSLIQKLLLPLLTISIIRNRDLSFARLVIVTIGLCLLLTSITTYIGCIKYPSASRDLAGQLLSSGDRETFMFYQALNIGGFGYIYTIVLLFPLLILLIKETGYNKIIFKTIFVILLIWIYMVIMQSEYTTALIGSSLCFVLFFISSKKKNNIVGVVLLMVLLYYLSTLLLYFSTIIDSTIISHRMEDVSRILQGEVTTSGDADIDSRSYLYTLGWNAFLESPVIGTGKIVGGHSFLLNYLSRYGIIGLSIMIFMFIKMYNYAIKPEKGCFTYHYVLFVFFLQIIIAILNPIVFYNCFTVILPLFCFVIKRSRLMGDKYQNFQN